MANSLKLLVGACSFLVLIQFSWSNGANTDCAKLSEPLCADLNNKLSDDTVYVNLYLRARIPPGHDSCLYSNPNKNPDSNCADIMDSAFWAMLKRESEEAYTKYSSMMIDLAHPSQSLPYPGDSVGMFMGAIVTKSNLHVIVQDTIIQVAELYFFSKPIKISSPQNTSRTNNLNEKWLNFSVNGQVVPSIGRAKTFEVKIQW